MSDGPKFPPGTPEYKAYRTELLAELDKFIRRDPPYDQEPVYKAQQEARVRQFLGLDATDVEAVMDHLSDTKQSKE